VATTVAPRDELTRYVHRRRAPPVETPRDERPLRERAMDAVMIVTSTSSVDAGHAHLRRIGFAARASRTDADPPAAAPGSADAASTTSPGVVPIARGCTIRAAPARMATSTSAAMLSVFSVPQIVI
jgi:hypothetical protein